MRFIAFPKIHPCTTAFLENRLSRKSSKALPPVGLKRVHRTSRHGFCYADGTERLRFNGTLRRGDEGIAVIMYRIGERRVRGKLAKFASNCTFSILRNYSRRKFKHLTPEEPPPQPISRHTQVQTFNHTLSTKDQPFPEYSISHHLTYSHRNLKNNHTAYLAAYESSNIQPHTFHQRPIFPNILIIST